MTESAKSKLTVLVVDDQPEMRKSVARILRFAGMSPVEAASGPDALARIAAGGIDAVVSDLRMPGMDGISLLHEIRKSWPLPFLLMTGFAEIIQSAEAYEIGADGFLLKPFQQEEFLSSLRDAVEHRREKDSGVPAQSASRSDQYCGIPVGEFVGGREIRFPIYLKLSERKFVRIAFGGEDLSSDKIRELQQKGIKFLYLQRDDFKQYIAFAARMAEVVLQSPAQPSSRKAEILRHSSEVILEFGFRQYVDKEIFELAHENVQQCLSLLTDSRSVLGLLDSLTSQSQALYAHSLGVALVASLAGKALGWESSPLFFRVVSGSIMHDLGKKDFPLELRDKSSSEMNAEELALWRRHPQIGADLLAKVEDIPAEVVQIVLHHHELGDGSGFPLGLMNAKIHPVAKLIGLADEFFKRYRGEPGRVPGMPPAVVIQQLEALNRPERGLPPKWEFLPALKKAFPGSG